MRSEKSYFRGRHPTHLGQNFPQALAPVYNAIAHKAWNATVKHVDETSWKNQSKPIWPWVMYNRRVAFFYDP
ncbi:IS66 family transposase [Desulfatibacillum alkenivorans]|uniref:IS66 family transposase n=1 Tax=Desulfatibacillum alkenivorans TaxID=259354 RepID=UPI003CC7C924